MKYKGILFDLDFTLYNECDFLKAVVSASKISGDYKKKINNCFRIKSQNIIDDLLMIQNQLTKENSNHLFHIMKKIKLNLPKCYDNIIELLEKFKNNSLIKTGLVTNGVPEIQKNKMKCLGISKYFNQIIYAKELDYEKPDHVPFKLALERLSVDSSSVLYIGDHPLNDIKPANELGMDTLWVDHLNNNNIFATYRINDPNKLAFTIENL